MPTDRLDFIRGLREAADLLETNPDLNPTWGVIGLDVPYGITEAEAVARCEALAPARIESTSYNAQVKRELSGGVIVSLSLPSSLCESTYERVEKHAPTAAIRAAAAGVVSDANANNTNTDVVAA